MTPYELGIRTAQHANVPDHLKQAYAQGFAGVLEKRAEAELPKELTTLSGYPPPQLMGSRGRALYYGRPEPKGRDHDYVYFTDDSNEQTKLLHVLAELAKQRKWKQHKRSGGFLTISAPDKTMDISVYPNQKRLDILEAWHLIEQGYTKDEAWARVDHDKAQQKNAVYCRASGKA